ncbi:MAG: pitrilysin family protein [Cyanobacteria bacterium P01_E01_bin.42]
MNKTLKWLGLFLVTLVLIALSERSVTAATPRPYDELEFPPLPEVQLPDYDRYQLDNGIVVYLVQDRELPLVGGTALFNTGSRLEPADKVGLAGLTGSVMRSGGTAHYSPDALNEILESRAASVETSIGGSQGSASFNALSEDLEQVFSLFAEVVREPAFDADQFALAKKQIKGGIARRNDDPDNISSREFSKLIYGDESPYARTVEYDNLDNISRQDLIDFYHRSFRPEQMLLGIIGDFDRDRMKALIAEKFGDWQQVAASPLPALPEAPGQSQGGLFFVEQPQLTQSYIQIGHLGGMLKNPDYPALSVLNGVLNGFGGRLFNEVRSRRGLAYSVYGFWSPRYDYPGVFIAGGQTRSDATVPFIEAIFQEIAALRDNPISQAELDYAKESILNSFVFNFQEPAQTIQRLMRYEFYGYPPDYIFQYQRGIKATTVEDIQRVAREYLQPDRFMTLVVGNSADINPPLSNLNNNINVVDITIPASQSS